MKNDLISRQKAFEYFVALWECIGTIMDRDEWEDACITTANEIPSAQPAQSYTIHSDGRLWVTVDDIDKVNAVVVDESKSKFCKQFYLDALTRTRTISEGGEMKEKEFVRIKNAIRHIQTAVDVDPWAMEIAIDAMKRQLPHAPLRSVNNYNHNLIHLYCPRCGTWVGVSNIRLKKYDMHNNTNEEICGKCGQVFNLNGIIEDDEDGEQDQKEEKQKEKA